MNLEFFTGDLRLNLKFPLPDRWRIFAVFFYVHTMVLYFLLQVPDELLATRGRGSGAAHGVDGQVVAV